MRKITRDIAAAFNAQKSMTRSGNGATSTDGAAIFLHGNKIVERREDGIYVTLAGWNTTTTRERLKPFASVHSSKGQAFLNGEKWDGGWAKAGA
jgi:hypothetical protein